MSPHSANTINAFALMLGSAWAYLQPDFGSWTVFIPGAFGVVLLACTPGLKTQNKIIAHIAAALTLVIFLLLMVPLYKAFDEGDPMSALRMAAMLLTCLLALSAFVKSFREARRRSTS